MSTSRRAPILPGLLGRLLIHLIYLSLVASGLAAQAPSGADGELARIRAAAERPLRPYEQPAAAARYLALQRFPDGQEVDAEALYRAALEKVERMPRAKALGAWQFLGPGNIGGRTRALVIDPTDPETLYAGGVSGGLWKSEDGGGSWRPLGDLLPNIAVSSLAMDPSNPRILYAGTGEGVFREEVRGTSLPLRGAGIFKSENAGVRWRRVARGVDFNWVNDLEVSHGNPRRVYAATRTGVWRSLDAGATWRRILDPGAADGEGRVKGGCLDLALRTDRRVDTLFAACGTFEQATVYRTARAQLATPVWDAVLSEAGMGRTSLAVAPSDQRVMYALAASHLPGPEGRFEGGLHAVFRSERSGVAGSWTAVVRNSDPVKLNTLILSNPVIAMLEECDFGGSNRFSNLGWFTNVIAIDPVDPDLVFAGGVDLFRSRDAGRTWAPVTAWWLSPPSAHADQHVIRFHPAYDGRSEQRMWVGGDGGVWLATSTRSGSGGQQAVCDPASALLPWRSLNNNYGVTQFYHGTPHPRTPDRYFGGTQDNGTLAGSRRAGGDGWHEILGGDGGYVAIDPERPNIVYAESQGLGFRKSVDGGETFERAVDGITDQPGGGNDTGDLLFIVPFVLDPNEPRRLWLGGRHLWRTEDRAASWSRASTAWPSGGLLSAVAVATGDSERVVVGLSDGTIHHSATALEATPESEWPAARPRDGFVSWVAFDPSAPERVYATYATFGGRHVWASDDGGATWRPIDGAGAGRLPNLPVHSIVVDPDDPDRLFVGTDLGVFSSSSRGRRWSPEKVGFANAVTEALAIHVRPANGDKHLFAFTHGRGAWRVRLER